MRCIYERRWLIFLEIEYSPFSRYRIKTFKTHREACLVQKPMHCLGYISGVDQVVVRIIVFAIAGFDCNQVILQRVVRYLKLDNASFIEIRPKIAAAGSIGFVPYISSADRSASAPHWRRNEGPVRLMPHLMRTRQRSTHQYSAEKKLIRLMMFFVHGLAHKNILILDEFSEPEKC